MKENIISLNFSTLEVSTIRPTEGILTDHIFKFDVEYQLSLRDLICSLPLVCIVNTCECGLVLAVPAVNSPASFLSAVLSLLSGMSKTPY